MQKIIYTLIIFHLVANFTRIGAIEINDTTKLRFFEPSPIFNKTRFRQAAGFGIVAYTGFSYGLYNSWYSQFPQSKFHLFNDWGEWENVDKGGHVFSGYFQIYLCYKGAKWAGVSENRSILAGSLCGFLFQSTIEMMDGFSTDWGFSISDFGSNLIGISTFALQQKYWGEQRISLKESVFIRGYGNDFVTSLNGGPAVTLTQRVEQLYGKSIGARMLKDYNQQIYWASFNVHSFLPAGNKWPRWLNIAVGYGAENMFGGFKNEWEKDGFKYKVDLKRYNQLYLSLDYDLSRIKVRNPFLKSVMSVFNIVKFPAPGIEITSNKEVIFRILVL